MRAILNFNGGGRLSFNRRRIRRCVAGTPQRRSLFHLALTPLCVLRQVALLLFGKSFLPPHLCPQQFLELRVVSHRVSRKVRSRQRSQHVNRNQWLSLAEQVEHPLLP